MYRLYSLVLGALALAYLPVFLVRKVWRAGYPLALGERLGFVPLAPGPPRLWVHAVSVGEVMAAVPLVRALRGRWPRLEIVVSTVTATGARVARDRLPEAAHAFAMPLDLVGAMRRAMGRVAPRALLVLETELWPNLFRAARVRGVPAVVVNGRISDRSYRRYRRVRALFRLVLADVALFAMRSEEDARRIVELGAPPDRVVVAGNLKLEAPPPDPDAPAYWRARLGLADRAAWVAASTHRGEEEAVLDAHLALRRAGPLALLLAPRHPERAGEVEALVRARGLAVRRRTQAGAEAPGGADVVVLDTVGELASACGVGDVVFVGGSLVPVGGHNVIEPALHGRPVVFGPHMANFRDAAALLLAAGGAVQVAGGEDLGPAVGRLLGDPAARAAAGEAARAAVRAHQGACARTVAALAAVLGPSC